MWQDMGLYWAWRGDPPKDKPMPPTPTRKRIVYAEVIYNTSPDVRHKLAVGVWDDAAYTPVNRGDALCEVGWFIRNGATVVMPEDEPLQ